MAELLKFLDPEKVIRKLNIREDMIACDFGAGSGGWTIPSAKILRKGKVYALDVQEETISAIESRAQLDRLPNIETKICDLEKPNGSGLRDGFADIIIMSNILFQVEEKKNVLEEAARVLKKGGEILVVDWKKETLLGPKEERVDPEEVKDIAEEIGLNFKEGFEAGSYHFGLIFTK
jgi:ubiquinone/menaquinone biosynthesis C-methylase UbiE